MKAATATDISSCPVCFESYNDSDHFTKKFSCGFSCCLQCTNGLYVRHEEKSEDIIDSVDNPESVSSRPIPSVGAVCGISITCPICSSNRCEFSTTSIDLNNSSIIAAALSACNILYAPKLPTQTFFTTYAVPNFNFEENGVFGFFWINRLLYVAIRGSTTEEDWKHNVNIIPTLCSNGIVHAGFRNRSKELPIRYIVDQLEHVDYIIFCGHSLGGAVAKLAATDAITYLSGKNIVEKIKCITFGAPVVGKGVATIMDNYKDSFLHFCYYDDVVPKIFGVVEDNLIRFALVVFKDCPLFRIVTNEFNCNGGTIKIIFQKNHVVALASSNWRNFCKGPLSISNHLLPIYMTSLLSGDLKIIETKVITFPNPGANRLTFSMICPTKVELRIDGENLTAVTKVQLFNDATIRTLDINAIDVIDSSTVIKVCPVSDFEGFPRKRNVILHANNGFKLVPSVDSVTALEEPIQLLLECVSMWFMSISDLTNNVESKVPDEVNDRIDSYLEDILNDWFDATPAEVYLSFLARFDKSTINKCLSLQLDACDLDSNLLLDVKLDETSISAKLTIIFPGDERNKNKFLLQFKEDCGRILEHFSVDKNLGSQETFTIIRDKILPFLEILVNLKIDSATDIREKWNIYAGYLVNDNESPMLCGYSLKDFGILNKAKEDFIKYNDAMKNATDESSHLNNIMNLILDVTSIAERACAFMFSIDCRRPEETTTNHGNTAGKATVVAVDAVGVGVVANISAQAANVVPVVIDTVRAAVFQAPLQTGAGLVTGLAAGAFLLGAAGNAALVNIYTPNHSVDPCDMPLRERRSNNANSWFHSILGSAVTTISGYFLTTWYNAVFNLKGASAFYDTARTINTTFKEGGSDRRDFKSYQQFLWYTRDKLQVSTTQEMKEDELERYISDAVRERCNESKIGERCVFFRPSAYVEDVNWDKLCPNESVPPILKIYRIVFLCRLKLVLAIHRLRKYFSDFRIIRVCGDTALGKSLIIKKLILSYDHNATNFPLCGSAGSNVTKFPRLYALNGQTKNKNLYRTLILDTVGLNRFNTDILNDITRNLERRMAASINVCSFRAKAQFYEIIAVDHKIPTLTLVGMADLASSDQLKEYGNDLREVPHGFERWFYSNLDSEFKGICDVKMSDIYDCSSKKIVSHAHQVGNKIHRFVDVLCWVDNQLSCPNLLPYILAGDKRVFWDRLTISMNLVILLMLWA